MLFRSQSILEAVEKENFNQNLVDRLAQYSLQNVLETIDLENCSNKQG